MNLCNVVRPPVGLNQKNMRKSAVSCLQVENVSCRYNGRNVLEQLSLTVADNEIVCLLGGNASGKSTSNSSKLKPSILPFLWNR